MEREGDDDCLLIEDGYFELLQQIEVRAQTHARSVEQEVRLVEGCRQRG